MADNILIDQGSTTTLRTKDVGGVHHGVAINMDSTGAEVGVAAKPFQVSLANHAANAVAVKVDGSASTQPVSGTVTVTGVATAANQATMLGYLDGVEGLLATIDADTGSIATTSASIDSKITACNTGAVTISGALPAGTNLIGRVSSSDETSTIYNGTTAITPKFAVLDAASSGDNTLIAAVTSKKIRVLSLFLVSAGAVNVRFESGASGTALTGQMNLVANTGFVLPYNPLGWFETASNTLLNLELSAAISVDGSIVYAEV